MAEAKTLEFYLANPDEMPDDISQLANELEPKDEAVVEDVKETDEPSAVEAEKPEEAKVEEAPKEKEEAPVLLSKNGKTEIPYQVLVSERERRAQAEKAAEDLRKQLAEIESKVAAVGEKKSEAQPEPASVEVDIDQVTEDFPEIAKAMKAMQAQIEAANAKLKQVEEIESARQAQEVQTVRSKVQEAIDANPVLRYWQNEQPEMFERASELDARLKQDPEIAKLSMEQRFDRVVKAMTAIFGDPNLPDAYKSSDAPKTDDMNELTEKAKSVVKETGQFKPRSLSDIPGGTPPSASESEKLSTMSPAQLAAMMHGMDSDQINTMLAKLG